jgi:hypothetical protein
MSYHKISHINPPKVEFAMIIIKYAVIDGEGDKLFVTTWWTGRSGKAALRSWLARRRDVNPADVEHTVVTEFKPVSRFEPLGERVEVPDETLAALG